MSDDTLSGQLHASMLADLIVLAAIVARRYIKGEPSDAALIADLDAWTLHARESLLTMGISAHDRQWIYRAAVRFLQEVSYDNSRQQWDGTERRQAHDTTAIMKHRAQLANLIFESKPHPMNDRDDTPTDLALGTPTTDYFDLAKVLAFGPRSEKP